RVALCPFDGAALAAPQVCADEISRVAKAAGDAVAAVVATGTTVCVALGVAGGWATGPNVPVKSACIRAIVSSAMMLVRAMTVQRLSGRQAAVSPRTSLVRGLAGEYPPGAALTSSLACLRAARKFHSARSSVSAVLTPNTGQSRYNGASDRAIAT